MDKDKIDDRIAKINSLTKEQMEIVLDPGFRRIMLEDMPPTETEIGGFTPLVKKNHTQWGRLVKSGDGCSQKMPDGCIVIVINTLVENVPIGKFTYGNTYEENVLFIIDL